jgi:hypothetical protein
LGERDLILHRALKTLEGMPKTAKESQQTLQKALNRKVSDFDSGTSVLAIVENIDVLREIYDGKMEQLENYLKSFNDRIKP